MDQSEQARFRPLVQARLDAIGQELETLTGDTEAIAPDASIGRLSRLDSMQMQQMALAGKRRPESSARTRRGWHGDKKAPDPQVRRRFI